MLAVVFGLLGALVYGFSDFLGGLGAKRMGSLRLSWFSIITGAITVVIIFFATGGNWATQASPAALMWGAISGLFGSFALLFLYACLALGPMSILSPLSALVAAIVPVIWDIASGTQLTWLHYIAIVIALVAVGLVGTIRENTHVRPTARGLTFATLAGLLIGGYLICIDQAPADSGIVPFFGNRATAFVVMSLILGGSLLIRWAHRRGLWGRDGKPRADMVVGDRGALDWKWGIILAVATGVTDTFGNFFILTGIRLGELSVVGVMSSMYPAGTIVLALLVLRERLTILQGIGLALAIVAAALLSLA